MKGPVGWIRWLLTEFGSAIEVFKGRTTPASVRYTTHSWADSRLQICAAPPFDSPYTHHQFLRLMKAAKATNAPPGLGENGFGMTGAPLPGLYLLSLFSANRSSGVPLEAAAHAISTQFVAGRAAIQAASKSQAVSACLMFSESAVSAVAKEILDPFIRKLQSLQATRLPAAMPPAELSRFTSLQNCISIVRLRSALGMTYSLSKSSGSSRALSSRQTKLHPKHIGDISRSLYGQLWRLLLLLLYHTTARTVCPRTGMLVNSSKLLLRQALARRAARAQKGWSHETPLPTIIAPGRGKLTLKQRDLNACTQNLLRPIQTQMRTRRSPVSAFQAVHNYVHSLSTGKLVLRPHVTNELTGARVLAAKVMRQILYFPRHERALPPQRIPLYFS